MGYTIAFSNQKGGTGKTTTVINTAGALAEQGKRVLLIDADPQASLTVGFGLNMSELNNNVYHAMVEQQPLQDILISVRENIDIAPTNIMLSAAEMRLATEYRREDRLALAIKPVKDQYDVIFIDCPPSLGILTINALSAADGVVIPMSCDYYSLIGVHLLLDTIQRITGQINPDLRVIGVLPTRYDRRTLHSKEVLAGVRERLKGQVYVFDAIIRESVRLKEAPIEGKTITEYMRSHPVAQDYVDFATELANEI